MMRVLIVFIFLFIISNRTFGQCEFYESRLLKTISCELNYYKITNDTFYAIAQDSCNDLRVDLNKTGTWKIFDADSTWIKKIETVKDGKLSGIIYYYLYGHLYRIDQIKQGRINIRIEYFQNDAIGLKEKYNRKEFISRGSYWDNKGNKVDGSTYYSLKNCY